MLKRETILVYSLVFAGLMLSATKASAQEPVAREIAVKMVLKNIQVKKVREAEGEVISIKLTDGQKRLIQLNAPKFRGNIIRLSTKHLKKGTNKITVLIIKPTSEIPLLRVVPPGKPGGESSAAENMETSD